MHCAKLFCIKKIFCAILYLLFCALVFFSCTTVPGEMEVRLKNIDSEYVIIANGYMNISNYTKAIEYYQRARTNSEFTAYCDFHIARSLALSKNWTKAKEAYEVLCAQDTENTLLLSSYAYVLTQIGEIDSALALYESLIERNADDILIAQNYILLLLFIEDIERAQTQFELFKENFAESDQIVQLQNSFTDFEKAQKAAENAKTEESSVETGKTGADVETAKNGI